MMKSSLETHGDKLQATTFVTKVIGRMVGWLVPQRLKILPAAVAIIVWGGWLISLWRGSGILDAFGNVVGGDFVAFYTGGRFLLDGRFAQVYDLSAQSSFQASVASQYRQKVLCHFSTLRLQHCCTPLLR